MQQTSSLIGACRATKPCENQKLSGAMSRRGLSFFKPKFQKILVIVENYFRRKTEASHLREKNVKKTTYG